jgi:hypothetical protein
MGYAPSVRSKLGLADDIHWRSWTRDAWSASANRRQQDHTAQERKRLRLVVGIYGEYPRLHRIYNARAILPINLPWNVTAWVYKQSAAHAGGLAPTAVIEPTSMVVEDPIEPAQTLAYILSR